MEKLYRRYFNVIVREDKGMRPIVLKCGLALALTFAGFLYSHFRTKRIKPSPKGHLSGHGSEANLRGIRGIRVSSSSSNIRSEGNNFDTVVCRSSPIGISPRIKQNEEKDDELNDPPVAYVSLEKDDYEQEIRKLRNMVMMLQERERSLEVQLLEYCGLREQEAVADALREESDRLKRENERLMKEVEQLQADKCTDVEELVYLRWINACLRHESRNFHPPPGKTVARDLSKSLSPDSERKAKQLILEYANNEGRTSCISDVDSDQWSSSQASFMTDTDECSPLENSSDARVNNNSSTNKSKIFGKLMKLMRGKDNRSNISSRVPSLEKYRSREDSTNNSPYDIGAYRSEYGTPTETSRHSLDLNRTSSSKEDNTNRRNSDVGSSKNCSPATSGAGDLKISSHSFSESYSSEKSNLTKYAEALKNSSSSETSKHVVRRRSSSYSSF
ncbi:hypothetical protein TSUD_356000 [Trifolium subterraneum]|uniref:Protein CHUP1, chloroplastic n=1 Tax=Trifolium subterraneum TaxID=3900 RepID=A0A2Z6LYM8_TRISU|nr:hypothetical protein TSUD_356000 [Trifolium subterraneum]